MHTAVAIFAKTIGLSPVKTRLAKTIGQAQAEAFYQLSIAATEALIKSVQARYNLIPVWALGEADALDLPQWQTFARRWTGPGDLGQRLHHIYQGLQQTYTRVVLMGTDSPHLQPDALIAVLDQLADNPEACITIPAIDGGFCVWAGQRPIAQDTWCQVRYSQEDTLAQLKHQVNQAGIEVIEMPPQSDVDTIEDLYGLQRLLSEPSDLLPEQVALLEWVNRLLH